MRLSMPTPEVASTPPREKPILFSGPMVRAILEGRKGQTRRVVKPQPPTREAFFGSDFGLSRAVADGVKMYSQSNYARLPRHPTDWELVGSVGVARDAGFPVRYRCPYGQPGERLWVKETWAALIDPSTLRIKGTPERTDHITYRADGEMIGNGFVWRPSIFMPRWASRITLEVTGVRVERLQDISEEDAESEGPPGAGSPRDRFMCLWNAINGNAINGSWAANPWVFVIEFRKVTP